MQICSHICHLKSGTYGLSPIFEGQHGLAWFLIFHVVKNPRLRSNRMVPLIQKIKPENFREEVVIEPRLVLLLCMPQDDEFPQQRKIVEEIAGLYHEKLKVVIPEEAFLTTFKRDFKVTGTPTFLILRRGVEIARLLGVTDREPLIEAILESAKRILKEDW